MIYTGSSELNRTMWNISTLSQSIVRIQPPFDLRERIEAVQQIPLLSVSSTKLIQLVGANEIDLEGFVEIVERDPFLSLQVFKAANSAIYSYRGQLNTLQEAIVRVIGLDKAICMALGLTMINAIQCRKNGVLGLKSYWSHAMLCAELLLIIQHHCPFENSVNSLDVHLAGLFHDIGFPLLGHFFPEIHQQLNRMVGSNPSIPELAIEKFSLGVTHCELGYWLVKAWNLPTAVSTAILNHHAPDYRGEHWQINLMIGLADRLLHLHKTGILDGSALEQELYVPLGLSLDHIESIAASISDIVTATAQLTQEYFSD